MSKTTSTNDGLAPDAAARRAELEALLAEKEARLQCRLVEHQRLQAENAALEQECRTLHAKNKESKPGLDYWLERIAHQEAQRSLQRSAEVTAVRASADEEEARGIKISAELAKTRARHTNTISTLEHDVKTAAASAQTAEEGAEKNKATAAAYKAAVQSNALLVVGEAAKFCHPRARSLDAAVTAARRRTRQRRNAVAHPQLTSARVLKALDVLSKSEPDTVSAMKRLLAAARSAFDTDEEFDKAMAAFRSV